MINRRRGERLALEQPTELTIMEPSFANNGPFVVCETSYEFGRKFGVHLNLLLTGLRFTGNINLEPDQKISFRVPEEPEILTGSIAWKKEISENEFSYGVKVHAHINRRSNDRVSLDDSETMTLLKPEPSGNCSFIVEEMSYGLVRKFGVHLSPHISGLRLRSDMELTQGQELSFQMSSEEETLTGKIVRKEKLNDSYSLYGIQVI